MLSTIPDLSIGRAYTAMEAAAILGLSKSTFNEKVRQGHIKPIFQGGERRFSGYMLARLLGWPLSDDPRDYMPRRVSPAEAAFAADRMDFPPHFANGPRPFGTDY